MTFAPDALTTDAFLGGRLSVQQPKSGYRAATDPVFLAAAVPAQASQSVLELGCGVGVAALCLARRTGAAVTGVELQPAYAELARENARRNGCDLDVVTADISALPAALRARSFDHVMFNPPYFRPATGTAAADPGRERANREDTPLAVWIDTGLRRLAPKGWLTMIHLAERLPEVLAAAAAAPGPVGSVTVLPLVPRAGRAAGRVLIRMRKGGKGPFCLKSPLILHGGDRHERDGDDYSGLARGVLRDGAALDWACS